LSIHCLFLRIVDQLQSGTGAGAEFCKDAKITLKLYLYNVGNVFWGSLFWAEK
jgi:hypothetical protein